MQFQHKAVIQWISPEQGGRRAVPVGRRYSTVARFKGVQDLLDEFWSVVVELEESPSSPMIQTVRLTFLSDDAPTDLLAKYTNFELLEGSRVVARGETLE